MFILLILTLILLLLLIINQKKVKAFFIKNKKSLSNFIIIIFSLFLIWFFFQKKNEKNFLIFAAESTQMTVKDFMIKEAKLLNLSELEIDELLKKNNVTIEDLNDLPKEVYLYYIVVKNLDYNTVKIESNYIFDLILKYHEYLMTFLNEDDYKLYKKQFDKIIHYIAQIKNNDASYETILMQLMNNKTIYKYQQQQYSKIDFDFEADQAEFQNQIDYLNKIYEIQKKYLPKEEKTK